MKLPLSSKDTNTKVAGAVALTAVMSCNVEIANKCDAFLASGVDKVDLDGSQTNRVLELALSAGNQLQSLTGTLPTTSNS